MSNLPFVPHPSGDPLGASDAQGVPGMPSLALLMETDHLLDRLGDRGPRPSDLDDPLAAALALLAADVDVEPVSADATRRRLASFGAWPLRQDLRSAGLESLAHTIDVRDLRVVGATVDNHAAAWDEDSARDTADELDEVSGAGRLAQTREVGIRLVPALVAAGAAIVLSMGAAAALSSGEMPNPAKMVKEIVNDLTGDTTSGSGPNGADALAEPQRRGPGSVPSDSSGGGGQPLAPGALPGASVSPTAAPSGSATGADPTSPGGLAPALLDLLPVLPAPTLSSTDGAQPGSSSATSGSGTGTGVGTGASATTSSSTESSSSETTASSEPSESSSSSEPPSESTTSEPTPSVGPTGSTTEPDPTETTSPPPTSPSTDEESASGTGTTEHGASGESAVAQIRPFSDSSPLPTVAYEPPPAVVGTASTSDSATTDPDATTPHQADLFASGGV